MVFVSILTFLLFIEKFMNIFYPSDMVRLKRMYKYTRNSDSNVIKQHYVIHYTVYTIVMFIWIFIISKYTLVIPILYLTMSIFLLPVYRRAMYPNRNVYIIVMRIVGIIQTMLLFIAFLTYVSPTIEHIIP